MHFHIMSYFSIQVNTKLNLFFFGETTLNLTLIVKYNKSHKLKFKSCIQIINGIKCNRYNLE